MHSEKLATHWRSLDDAARTEWLKKLLTVDLCVSAEQLDIKPEELDLVASKAGLVGVCKTVVDAAGMRDWEHGVVGPKFAQHRHKRTLKISK
ncbi:hypothetical protein WL29_23635 [Burkholderia ubonensis]|uniref:Uncharacterized protein n=1 Tax=Burkholderia ubonensis TaxID=101571 RepID=A0A106QC99_9BURK|nr:hypothetical protein [Burkholderia ubonensis]KWA84325.1 hypothetical protein WL29_23635 [Burkholderia ubonensis]